MLTNAFQNQVSKVAIRSSLLSALRASLAKESAITYRRMELSRLLWRRPQRDAKNTFSAPVNVSLAVAQFTALAGDERAAAFQTLLSRPWTLTTAKVVVACVTLQASSCKRLLEAHLPALAAALGARANDDVTRVYLYRALLRWSSDPVLSRLRTLRPATASLALRSPCGPLADEDIPGLSCQAPASSLSHGIETLMQELFGSGAGDAGGLLADADRLVLELSLSLEAAGVTLPSRGGRLSPGPWQDEDGTALVDAAGFGSESESRPEDTAKSGDILGGTTPEDCEPHAVEVDDDGECWIGTTDTGPTASHTEAAHVLYGSIASDADIISAVSAGGADFERAGEAEEVMASSASIDPALYRCLAESLLTLEGNVLPALRRSRARVIAMYSTAGGPGAQAAFDSMPAALRGALPLIERRIVEFAELADCARRIGVRADVSKRMKSGGKDPSGSGGIDRDLEGTNSCITVPSAYASSSLQGRLLTGKSRRGTGRGGNRVQAHAAVSKRPPRSEPSMVAAVDLSTPWNGRFEARSRPSESRDTAAVSEAAPQARGSGAPVIGASSRDTASEATAGHKVGRKRART